MSEFTNVYKRKFLNEIMEKNRAYTIEEVKDMIVRIQVLYSFPTMYKDCSYLLTNELCCN